MRRSQYAASSSQPHAKAMDQSQRRPRQGQQAIKCGLYLRVVLLRLDAIAALVAELGNVAAGAEDNLRSRARLDQQRGGRRCPAGRPTWRMRWRYPVLTG